MKPLEAGLERRRSKAATGAGMAGLLVVFVLIQIFLGALVAGLDAGLTYTTWPLMDGDFIPPAYKLFIQSPWYINLGENPLTVQFIHRMGAYALLAFVIFHAWRMVRTGAEFKDRKMAGALGFAVAIQAVIGIITLISQVEMQWALFHQFWAFVLLGLAVLHRARLVGHGLSAQS
jgi:cytochrome c oxidase assembly protein subunit 15